MAKRRPNMDHGREGSNEDGGTFTKYYNPLAYKPLPDKVGTQHVNKVFFSLMNPSRWKLFNPTPEMVGQFGMVGTGNQLLSVPSDLATFSFKIPVHPVGNFHREDGSKGFGNVICPVALNDYLTRVHGYGQLFDRPRCAHCEKSNEQWKMHNQRWEELGYDSERKKGLGKEEYKRIIDNDPLLKKSRAQARLYSPQDRYLLQPWDHSKFSGERPMDEGQTSMQFQFWLAPKTVHDALQALFVNEVEFYDATSELGVPMMLVTKDTSKCAGTDFSQTKYTVMFSGTMEKYPQDWVDYMDNEDAWPDPTGAILSLVSYDEMRKMLLENEAEKSQSSYNSSPAPQSGFTPPSAPAQPSVASFQSPPSAPSAPVAPPTRVAPSVPSAPAPVAAPAAPVAPSAPIPVSPPAAPSMPSFGTAPQAPGMMPDRAPATKKHNW